MRVRLLSSAATDLGTGFAFFEDQEHGLGAYFRESILKDLKTLKTSAGIHSRVLGYHGKVASVFPFGIYSRFSDGEVVVVAILDSRQNPKLIRRSLRNR